MKLGICLEGGASRTYFSVGVMDALCDLDIMTDYVIGASAGIANGISYVSKQKGRNLEIGLKYVPDKRYMGVKYLFDKKNKSYYNIDFVFSEIPNKYLPFDYETYNNYKGEVIAVVTNLENGKPEYLKVDGSDREWKKIVASCALPIFFTPINVDGKRYMDGGISDPIPFKRAFSDGCDKVICVLTREKDYIKGEESGIKVCSRLYKKYDKFVDALHGRADIYNKSHREAYDLEKQGKILLVAPESTEGWHRTSKEPELIKKMYDLGYKNVMERKEEFLAFAEK